MDLAFSFYLLGRLGARSAASWESAVATWIDDGKGPMPTQQECQDALNAEDVYQAQIASYADSMTGGYEDADTGIKLKTTQAAQDKFTSLITMLQEGLALGVITNDSNQVIWNYDNQPITLTVLQIRQLLFRYGIYCKTFFDEYAP